VSAQSLVSLRLEVGHALGQKTKTSCCAQRAQTLHPSVFSYKTTRCKTT